MPLLLLLLLLRLLWDATAVRVCLKVHIRASLHTTAVLYHGFR
jgi:hypothetical protein